MFFIFSTRFKSGPGYNTLIWWLILRDLLSACPHTLFNTQPGLYDSGAALSNSYPNACVPCSKALCAKFMMVFAMNQLRSEPATYCMRSTHANHLTNVMWWCIFRFNTSIMVLDTCIIWDKSSFITILICVAASQFASACVILDSLFFT